MKGGIWTWRRTCREDDVMPQGDVGHLQAKEKGLEQTLPHSPETELALPTPWSWSLSLQTLRR